MIRNISFDRPVHVLRDLPNEGLPEICISGRSNVGKSSLINRIARRRGLAKISQTPGKTRALNYYRVDKCCFLVDLPGYGYAKVSKTQRREFAGLIQPYLKSREELRGIMQLIDARHGPVAQDNEMLEWMKSFRGNVLYVFTKSDKLSNSERANMKNAYAGEFGAENIAMFSASTGMGVDDVWNWISKTIGI